MKNGPIDKMMALAGQTTFNKKPESSYLPTANLRRLCLYSSLPLSPLSSSVLSSWQSFLSFLPSCGPRCRGSCDVYGTSLSRGDAVSSPPHQDPGNRFIVAMVI